MKLGSKVVDVRTFESYVLLQQGPKMSMVEDADGRRFRMGTKHLMPSIKLSPDKRGYRPAVSPEALKLAEVLLAEKAKVKDNSETWALTPHTPQTANSGGELYLGCVRCSVCERIVPESEARTWSTSEDTIRLYTCSECRRGRQ